MDIPSTISPSTEIIIHRAIEYLSRKNHNINNLDKKINRYINKLNYYEEDKILITLLIFNGLSKFT
jgi:hypothetical protein